MPDPIVVDSNVQVPATAISVTAVRASGPGGQNVNKVSSKVDLRVDLSAIVGLTKDAYERLLVKAAPRLDGAGLLQVTSQRTRDQAKNLADAYEKVRALIAAAMVKPIPRKPTKPSRGVVEHRLSEKRKTAERKKGRSTRAEGD